MTIKNKLMLLSFVIVLIPFLISHFFVYLQSTSTITEEILHHIETVAEYHKQKMKNEIVHNRERLALVSSRTQLRLSLKKFIEDSKKEYQAKMNKILRDACASIPSFKSISVMTLDGKIVASTDASVLGKDASNMEAFVQGKIR
ncbi:MAG: hypothetical protein KAQ72_14840, partial [Desulfobacula sp.]|nr:hypothetical protein [Desulfobacula sp.]